MARLGPQLVGNSVLHVYLFVFVVCYGWQDGFFADGWELASVGDPRGSMLGLIFFLLFFWFNWVINASTQLAPNVSL